jgi:hypothetical protein
MQHLFFVAPRVVGVTYDELIEVGKRAGYQAGEIGDALRFVTTPYFFSREDPDYRNFDAFDFVVAELNALARAEGAARALLQRSVMVERATIKDIPRHDVEVAITYQVMADLLSEKAVLRFPRIRGFEVCRASN